MKNRDLWLLLFFLIWVPPPVVQGQCPEAMPTSDFSANFSGFPFAWEFTRGVNTQISILTDHPNGGRHQHDLLQKIAPEAVIKIVPMSDFLEKRWEPAGIHVALVGEQIQPDEYVGFISALDQHARVTVVQPAYFGPMDDDTDHAGWIEHIRASSAHGAVIAGSHGDMYQLGDLSYWESVPVDVFAVLGRRINGFQAMEPDHKITTALEESAYLVAGAVDLLKSRYPDLGNHEIKKALADKSRKVFWSLVEIPEGQEGMTLAIPHFNRNYLGKYENLQIRQLKRNIYEASSLDLMALFDITCEVNGGWCYEILRVAGAQKIASGRNITVAILDQGFNKNHPALQNRTVFPHSFIEGVDAMSEASDHGTFMAESLVHVAPDVKIMPVVICGNDHWGDADMYIRGIEYAVEKGAEIISLSHRKINEIDQPKLDEAIQNATDNGVVFVYIHYAGEREDVIIPCPVEFARYNSNPELVYIIGTRFLDRESPITWGVSQTAPIVSGVIAMMKELRPDLKPLEIKQILLASTRITRDGIPILDAEKALENLIK
jgi:subtilisin family serine protease